jgi:hypothetical protein
MVSQIWDFSGRRKETSLSLSPCRIIMIISTRYLTKSTPMLPLLSVQHAVIIHVSETDEFYAVSWMVVSS